MHQGSGGGPVGRSGDLGQPSLIFKLDVIGHEGTIVDEVFI
jgi:hypothetical protein